MGVDVTIQLEVPWSLLRLDKSMVEPKVVKVDKIVKMKSESNGKRKCEVPSENDVAKKLMKSNLCEALENCHISTTPPLECCLDGMCQNCEFMTLCSMVSNCLIDSRKKLVPSMINYRKNPKNSKSNAKNPFSGPNLASFARIEQPTNTPNPQTSDSDSGSSQDGFIRMLRPKIPKAHKNPQAVPKAQRLKTSFRRRRSMLTSEPAEGRQRLLSEFFRAGMDSTNQRDGSGQEDL